MNLKYELRISYPDLSLHIMIVNNHEKNIFSGAHKVQDDEREAHVKDSSKVFS